MLQQAKPIVYELKPHCIICNNLMPHTYSVFIRSKPCIIKKTCVFFLALLFLTILNKIYATRMPQRAQLFLLLFFFLLSLFFYLRTKLTFFLPLLPGAVARLFPLPGVELLHSRSRPSTRSSSSAEDETPPAGCVACVEWARCRPGACFSLFDAAELPVVELSALLAYRRWVALRCTSTYSLPRRLSRSINRA